MAVTKPEAILFDLDGTLIDTATDFHRAVNMQRQRHRLNDLDIKRVRQNVSEGAKALIKLSFQIDEEHQDFDTLRQELLSLYLDHIAVTSRLFEGFEKVLKAMEENDMPWGIVTNKPRLYSEALLEKLQLHSRSSTLICPDDVGKSKPHPEPLLKAAKQIKRSVTDVWYVGDHGRDIEAGKRAGMKTLAAAYGYIPAGESVTDWQADHIINEPLELLDMISFR